MNPHQTPVAPVRSELTADIAETAAPRDTSEAPDDNRRATGPLHRTSERERAHRDHGGIRDSNRLSEIRRRNAE